MIETVICSVVVHSNEAIDVCMGIDINQAIPSTSSPARDFGEKIYVFLKA